MVARRGPGMSVETLAALGTERLAKILHEIARADPPLRERLERTISESPPVGPGVTAAMLASIERRLSTLEENDIDHGWRAAGAFGADIDAIRQDIVENVLPGDPEAAAGMLERLVDLEHFLFESADDSDGEIGEALMAVVNL